MAVRIGCVVEGHAEVASLPALIRRIAIETDASLTLELPHPIRITKSKLMQPGELEKATELAALKAGDGGGVFVLLDCDDDCPAQLGPRLLDRMQKARPDRPCAAVVAKREFESWFLASAKSLRGCRGLPPDLDPPEQPEEISGAKEWISRHIEYGTYSSTVDQTPLTHAIDFTLARRADSFDKCYREIVRLLKILSAAA